MYTYSKLCLKSHLNLVSSPFYTTLNFFGLLVNMTVYMYIQQEESRPAE